MQGSTYKYFCPCELGDQQQDNVHRQVDLTPTALAVESAPGVCTNLP